MSYKRLPSPFFSTCTGGIAQGGTNKILFKTSGQIWAVRDRVWWEEGWKVVRIRGFPVEGRNGKIYG